MSKSWKTLPLTCGTIVSMVENRTDWGSPSTKQGYDAMAVQLRGCANGGFETRVIDDAFCEEFARYLLAHVKPSSARGYMEKLRTIMRRLKKDGLIAEMPVMDFKVLFPKAEEAEKVFLTKEELHRMQRANCPSKSTKDAFLFSCYTGLMRGEVKGLLWDDIRYSGKGLVLSRPIENSDEHVKVPLVEPAREILSSLEHDYSSLNKENQDDHVFHLPSNTTIRDHLCTWAKEAGIDKNINYMTSRHTFATMALRAGVDLYVVSKWCGYSSVSAAQPYADLVGLNNLTSGDLLEAAFRG